MIAVTVAAYLLIRSLSNKTEDLSQDGSGAGMDREERQTADASMRESDPESKLMTSISLAVPGTNETVSVVDGEGKWSEGYVLAKKPVAVISGGAIAGILEVNSGGNARDVYLAVFEPGEAAWQMSDAKLLGEHSSNAEVTDISEDDGVVTVDFNTYAPGAAQADEKTVKNEESFTYSGGKLTP